VAGKRVVIAGGGLIGCAIAWRLAERGADVHVIESARPGMAASWAAAGMLAPLFEAPNAAMRDLLARSLNRYQDFVDELRAVSGIDAELQLGGKLDIAHTDDELRLLRKHYGDSLPAGVRELSAAEVRDIEPNVTQDFTAALLSENDGSVDNRKLARAAWVAASNAGATFTTGASVREVLYTRSTLRRWFSRPASGLPPMRSWFARGHGAAAYAACPDHCRFFQCADRWFLWKPFRAQPRASLPITSATSFLAATAGCSWALRSSAWVSICVRPRRA
jgi:cation diffusion facilitator CzcD-associated flavoprotein CzcO